MRNPSWISHPWHPYLYDLDISETCISPSHIYSIHTKCLTTRSYLSNILLRGGTIDMVPLSLNHLNVILVSWAMQPVI